MTQQTELRNNNKKLNEVIEKSDLLLNEKLDISLSKNEMNTQENLQKQEINLKPNSIINSIGQENKKKEPIWFSNTNCAFKSVKIDFDQNNVSLNSHQAGVNSIIQLRDGRLASCSNDKSIPKWDLNTCKLLFCLHGTRALLWN